MYFQKGKNFIHISSKNFLQLTNYIIIFESFFKEEKREISHSCSYFQMEISTKTSTAQKTSTLGKSRKKKAAPPPPTVQQQQQTKISSSATTDTKSTSSPAKTKKKAKKPPQDEFMAFKVKVIKLKKGIS